MHVRKIFIFTQTKINTDAPYEIFIESRMMGRTIILEVEPSDTIGTVKAKIRDEEGIPPACQELGLSILERQLEDGRDLRDYNIWRRSTLYLLVRPWKGNYCRVSVLKHVHSIHEAKSSATASCMLQGAR